MKDRLTLGMSGMDAMILMSDGNPGAIIALSEIMQANPRVDPDSSLGGWSGMLFLDTLDIYGSDIWLLFKDICGQDPVKVLALLRAVQMGLMDRNELKNGIESARRGPSTLTAERVEEALAMVKKKLPRFASEALPSQA